MSSQELTADQSVRNALARARDLPSVPAVALEVMRLARTEEADASALAEVVSLDPALAAKILRVANSALVGPSSEIVTLKRACTHLGFKTIKLWALSFAMVDSLLQPRTSGFNHDEYWRRSVFRAVSAKLVAKAVKPRLADEAFLTGLLSEIGQLVLASCLPNEFEEVRDAAGEEWPSFEVQRETIGFTTDQLGVALLETWGLPELIRQAILGAQTPDSITEDDSDTRHLAQILTVARFSETLFAGDRTSKALVDLYEAAYKSFALDKERVEGIFSELDQHTAEIAEILHVNLGEPIDSTSVLREAQLEMLRETVVLLRDAIINERRTEQLQFENSMLLLKAQSDPLTGLAHRSTFQETLDSTTLRVAGGGCPSRVGILMIDIDDFKSINDTHGHLTGDKVLQAVALVLRTYTREDDLPARYGGDEFAVVMLRTSLEGLKGAAERLRAEIAKQRVYTDDGPVSVTASIGGAHVGMFDMPVTPQELVRTADHSLYAAKEAGRNRCDFKVPGPAVVV